MRINIPLWSEKENDLMDTIRVEANRKKTFDGDSDFSVLK
jgi:hypothetical protein